MATYYVDPVSGSNGNAGTSFGAAWATIAYAATQVAAGDTVRLCATGTFTLTSSVSWSTAGTPGLPITIIGANSSGTVDGTKPTITSSTNSVDLFSLNGSHRMEFWYLSFTHTAGTRGKGFFVTNAGGVIKTITLHNVTIDGCSVGISANTSVTNELLDLLCENVEIKNCSLGAELTAGGRFIDCWIHNSTNAGLDNGGSAGGMAWQFDLIRSWVTYNGARGVDLRTSTGITGSTPRLLLVNSIVGFNTGTGVYIAQTTATQGYQLVLENSIIYGNGGYGIDAVSVPTGDINKNNAYGSNTSGNLSGLSAGTSDVTLTGDPFTNAAGGDFSLNNTAGAGAACRGAGFQRT